MIFFENSYSCGHQGSDRGPHSSPWTNWGICALHRHERFGLGPSYCQGSAAERPIVQIGFQTAEIGNSGDGRVTLRNGYPVGEHGEYEHRVVYERHFGPIPKGFHVHHKNEDIYDNRPENLEALSPVDHSRTHFKRYQRNDAGEWLKTCHMCGVQKPLTEFYAMGKGSHRRDCKPCQHKIVNAYNRMRRKQLKQAVPA